MGFSAVKKRYFSHQTTNIFSHTLNHFPSFRPYRTPASFTHPLTNTHIQYTKWHIPHKAYTDGRGASLQQVNLHSLKPELQPLIELQMTDEFICHASSPRQWLYPDDRLPDRNPLYVKLILAVQFHKCNFVGLCCIVLSCGCGVGVCAWKLTIPTSSNDSPALFYCIVFCIIRLVVKGLGDTAICQVHLLGEMQRNNGRSYGSLSVIK